MQRRSVRRHVPGDETTVEFDALPEPPRMDQDFLLYSDGWIKDSDLNTARTTVDPLPYTRSVLPYVRRRLPPIRRAALSAQ